MYACGSTTTARVGVVCLQTAPIDESYALADATSKPRGGRWSVADIGAASQEVQIRQKARSSIAGSRGRLQADVGRCGIVVGDEKGWWISERLG